MKPQQPRPNPEAHPVRDAPLHRIDAMRERIVAEIARDFDRDRQAEALGLVAQALLMEVRHRSSTEYASGWLDVMRAFFHGTLDDAARATMRLTGLNPVACSWSTRSALTHGRNPLRLPASMNDA